MTESLRDKSLSAFFWVLVDKLGGSVANFVVTLVLARLLMPEDFGLVAMVMVFFEISSSFIQSGFGYALVREKNISEIDKSTTFLFNLATAVFLYAVLFATAPFIAAFFRQDLLTAIVRVMGLNLIIGSFSIVQHAVLAQKIDFKTLTKVRLAAVVFSGVSAIVLAIQEFGVWSLVARIGLMELAGTIALWVLNPWKPSWQFSRTSFKKLFGFGSKILAEALIDKSFRHLVQIIIGRAYSAAMLGFFAQANTFCNMTAGNFLQTIQKISYPVLARMHDDVQKLKAGYRQIIAMSTFVILPVMTFMGVLADPLVVTLAGEKWRESVPFLQLLCAGGAVWHLNSINLDVLLVLGRVDLSLRLEIIKKGITALAIIIGMQFGIYGLVAGQVAAVYLSLFINTWYTDRLLDYTWREQARDVAATAGFSLITGSMVFLFEMYVKFVGVWVLLGGFGIGFAMYAGLHLATSTKEVHFLKTIVLPKIRKILASRGIIQAS